MALSRISDLTAGTVPMIGTSLFEVSVPNAGAPSGYDSRKFTLTNLLSTSVLKAGDTMTGGLLVNGTITQGVANPNSAFQGIASISNAYNEIAVYGAGPGASAKYCAIASDNGYAYLYSSTNFQLRIQAKGASGILTLETGTPSVVRMIINASGNINAYASLAVCKADGSSYVALYDDGNSHIDSTTTLWINANGNPLRVAGPSTFTNKLVVQFPDDIGYQMLVGGTTAAVRVYLQTNKASIEGILPNISTYCPLFIGGSTLSFHIGGIARMTIDPAGNTTFNNYVKIAFPDSGAAQFLVAGTTYAMRVLTAAGYTEIASVTPTISGYAPLRISATTLELSGSQVSINTKTVIQSDVAQLWLKSLNNTISINMILECVGIRTYTMAVTPDGNWGVYDNTASRWDLTVTPAGSLTVSGELTAGNTLYANNWLFAFGGVKCRNNADTTYLNIYDDGNSHIESNTGLQINVFLNAPISFGGAMYTKVISSTIVGQTANNPNPAIANLFLDDSGSGVANGGSVTFSASNGAWKYASIRGSTTNGGGNGMGDLYVSTRRATTDITLTPTAMFGSNGACYNPAGGWGVLSDRSLKQDIEPYERGLDAIVNLSPVQFRYQPRTLFSTEDAPSQVLYGLIADEVLPHIPEACGSIDFALDEDIDGEKKTVATLNPTDLIYSLINAVKELHAEIQSIKSSLH